MTLFFIMLVSCALGVAFAGIFLCRNRDLVKCESAAAKCREELNCFIVCIEKIRELDIQSGELMKLRNIILQDLVSREMVLALLTGSRQNDPRPAQIYLLELENPEATLRAYEKTERELRTKGQIEFSNVVSSVIDIIRSLSKKLQQEDF